MAVPIHPDVTETLNGDEAYEPVDIWRDLKRRMTYVIEFEEGGRYAGYPTAATEEEFEKSVEQMLDESQDKPSDERV